MKTRITIIFTAMLVQQVWSGAVQRPEPMGPKTPAYFNHPSAEKAMAEVTEYIEQVFNGSEWVDAAKYVNSYTPNLDIARQEVYEWQLDDWVLIELTINEYNSLDQLALATVFDRFDDTWRPKSRTTYAYDMNGNLIEEVSQYILRDEWQDLNQITYVWHDTYNLVSVETTSNWLGSEWVAMSRIIGDWNPTSQELTYITEEKIGADWALSEQDITSYNGPAGLLDARYINVWVDSAWVPERLISFEFSQPGNMFETITEEFWLDSIWGGGWILHYTYDNDDNLVEWMVEGVGVDPDTVVQLERTLWTYSDELTDVNQSSGNKNNIRFSQSAGGIEILLNLVAAAPTRAVVYDLSGKPVKQLTNGAVHEPRLEWNYTGSGGHKVAPGIYYINITSGNQSHQQKFFVD